jgi:transposase-like protein
MLLRNFSKEEIYKIYIEEYIEKGKGLRNVAKNLGIGDNRLRELFKSLNLRIKTGGERTGQQNNLIQNLPFIKIAKIYNVSDNSIRKWCKFYGLPTKKSDLNKIK